MEERDDVRLVQDARAELGEGPFWDARHGRIGWVDILGRTLHRLDPATGDDRPLATPLDVGAAVPRRAGGYLLALADGIWRVDGEDGAPERWRPIGADDPETRFNDGKCDAAGRFWVGTMRYDAAPGGGALYRIDPDGSVTTQATGVAISNGLAWSPDGRTTWYIDTLDRRVDAFATDPGTGAVTARSTAFSVEDADGLPDGMCIDAEGGLWIAFWGGSCVRRYDPATGRCDVRIALPVPNVTSCAFGGPDLADLYITTARAGLAPDALAAHPAAGGLFHIRPGVRGTPTEAFAG